jgi:hypothetical protein
MVKISGQNWTGSIQLSELFKARGSMDGYSWYFQSKENSFFIEIAEDYQITPEQLPLVGYGCGGWLYESNSAPIPNNEQDFISFLDKQLSLVFTLFKQNKLKYLPAVSCPCSE